MKIVFTSSECDPFAKTGGLADVSGSLPKQIAALGHSVCVVIPAYRRALQSTIDIQPTGINFTIPIGMQQVEGTLLKSRLPRSNVPVYLIQQEKYFDRDGLYQSEGNDYDDNCERFVFFCRAVLETIELLDLETDLIHCNDWQTGLIPAYLATELASVPRFENISSLMTIHNLAYQGMFWHWDMLLTGLDWKYFNWKQMEFYGQLNLLKTGIVFADAISTVSPTYANEIQTAEHGCGLESILRHRKANLIGIRNGIGDRWDPIDDPFIKANYGVSNWKIQKPKCKWDLQKELNLEIRKDVPLIGLIGRMVEQKGWSLITEILQPWLEAIDAQWAILGSGDRYFEEQLRVMQNRFPGKLSLTLGFDEPIAHRIEAGADIFLMPSQFEPCGLNQMYSLKYGTLPVVRETGGLADTIRNVSDESIANGTANGFSFGPYTAENLETTLARAVKKFNEHPDDWSQMVETGLAEDFSWTTSARQYESFYERIIATRSASLDAVGGFRK